MHVPIHPALYRYLRLAVLPTEVFNFKTPQFGLNKVHLVFTRIVENMAGYMRQVFSLRVHVYLDDWLFRHQQREFLLLHAPRIVQFLRSLGWEVNVNKSSPTPSQSFEYLGLAFHSDLEVVRLADHMLAKLLRELTTFRSQIFVTPRNFQSLLGLLNFLAPLVVLGRLRMHPLQCWLSQ